jgi:hypothetical protein
LWAQALDRYRFEPLLGKTKDYKIDICSVSTKHTVGGEYTTIYHTGGEYTTIYHTGGEYTTNYHTGGEYTTIYHTGGEYTNHYTTDAGYLEIRYCVGGEQHVYLWTVVLIDPALKI